MLLRQPVMDSKAVLTFIVAPIAAAVLGLSAAAANVAVGEQPTDAQQPPALAPAMADELGGTVAAAPRLFRMLHADVRNDEGE